MKGRKKKNGLNAENYWRACIRSNLVYYTLVVVFVNDFRLCIDIKLHRRIYHRHTHFNLFMCVHGNSNSNMETVMLKFRSEGNKQTIYARERHHYQKQQQQ